METNVDIKKTIYVSPLAMDYNILHVVSKMFKQKYEKSCDDKNGYILNIHSVKNITNMISKDSTYVQFNAILNATVIKPQIGITFSFKPSLIISRGIFGKIYDISLLIPEDYLKKKGWIFHQNTFIKNEGKETINNHSDLKVKILNYQFAGTKYNCICDLCD